MLRSTSFLAAFALTLSTTAFRSFADDTGATDPAAADAVEKLPTKIVPPSQQPPFAKKRETDSARAAHHVTAPRNAQNAQTDARPRVIRVPQRPAYQGLNPNPYLRTYSRWGLSTWQADELHRLAVDHAQQDAAMDFNQRDMQARAARLLSAHDQSLSSGLQLLKLGEYQRSILPLTLATRLDQGDPAARIHLAQARLALGHYDEAAAMLRRALQLQPHLIYADLQLADYLPDGGALADQTQRLTQWTRGKEASGEVLFLQGFFQLQLGDFTSANQSFQRAARLLPPKDIVLDYLEITRPSQSDAALTSASRSRSHAAEPQSR